MNQHEIISNNTDDENIHDHLRKLLSKEEFLLNISIKIIFLYL